MELKKDNDLRYEHMVHNPYNPFNRIIGGKKIVEYICVQRLKDDLVSAELKVICIHNQLSQTFDIFLNQEFKISKSDHDDILIATELFNNFVDKVLEQKEIEWIKIDLLKNPSVQLINQVLKCPS